MRTKFFVNGQKVTKVMLENVLGKKQLQNFIIDAKQTFMMDPNVQNDYYLGSYGMLTIIFE